jgi:hypothetical protein
MYPVDQVDQAAADAANGRDVELHRPDRDVVRLGAQLQRPGVGQPGVADPERDRAGRGPVGVREALCEAPGLGVDDEVDIALAVMADRLGAMPGDRPEPQLFEQAAERRRVLGGIFDEFKPEGAHGIVPQVGRTVLALRHRGRHLRLLGPGPGGGRDLIPRSSPIRDIATLVNKTLPPDRFAGLGVPKSY